MRRIAIMMGLFVLVTHDARAAAPSRQLLPTVYEAGHFYATPELANGKVVRLLVDTGGGGAKGLYVIDLKAAQRLGLDVTMCALGDEQVQVVKSPAFRPGKGLPSSPHTLCNSAAFVFGDVGGTTNGEDGLLGAGYLPRHIWTFDYPDQTLWLEPSSWRPAAGAHRTALGFQQNEKGKLATGMARITLTVDGQPLDLLLDTGATTKPTTAGKQASGTPTEHGIGVTSYISTSVLDRWHQQHPDWRIVANGDDIFGSQHATRLIEVPTVDIAGWQIGPVWFTERPDTAFSTDEGHVSSFMDKPVAGAAGGNIFGHFSMTIDYPAQAAWFTCVRQCKVASGK